MRYLYVAHLTCFILSFLSWFLGFSGKAYFLSSFLDYACIVLYQGAIFYGQYAYFTPIADALVPTDVDCTGHKPAYLMWLEIEIATFYGFILAGVLYLFLATIFSVVVDKDNTIDVSKKTSTDFMEYVSFQYIWFCFYITMTVVSITVYTVEKNQ